MPTLTIGGIPSEAPELAIVVHDPDAPRPFGFTHWLLYGVPAATTRIGADSEREYRPGVNDFGDRAGVGHGRRRAMAVITTTSGCTRSIRRSRASHSGRSS